jgi:hypothetical protein
MDLDWFNHFAESVWHASDSLELIPDLVAWLFCGYVALRLGKFVIFWRPRTCLTASLAWLGWLLWQAVCVSGIEAVYSAKHKGLAAYEATELFVAKLLALVKAWTDFFLPFMSDVCRWAFKVWKKLTVKQRLLVGIAALGCYAVLEVLRMFRRHGNLIARLFFHASFLAGGPLLWYSCGLLSSDIIPRVSCHAITTFPAVMSLLTIACAPDPTRSASDTPRASREDLPGRTKNQSRIPALPGNSTEMHRLWLSYWACWPALALLEAAVGMVPKLMPETGRNSQQLQTELHRSLITFVVWLQFWQGSRLLQRTVQNLLFNTSLLEHLARFSGARGLQFLKVMRGGLAAGAVPANSWRLWRLFRFIQTRLWLVGVATVTVLLSVLVLVKLFYHAVAQISRAATMMLWLAAATDSADTLTTRAEDLYTKKLSFWVMAMLWEALTKAPYFGLVLRLVTPISFALWLLCGDVVLRRLVLPFLQTFINPLRSVGACLLSACRCPRTAAPIDSTPVILAGDTGGEPRERNAIDGDILQEAAITTGNATGGVGGLEDDAPQMTVDGADTGGTGVAMDAGIPEPEADNGGTVSKEQDIRKRKKGGRK